MNSTSWLLGNQSVSSLRTYDLTKSGGTTLDRVVLAEVSVDGRT